jgi:hypothetical protein
VAGQSLGEVFGEPLASQLENGRTPLESRASSANGNPLADEQTERPRQPKKLPSPARAEAIEGLLRNGPSKPQSIAAFEQLRQEMIAEGRCPPEVKRLSE